MKFWWYSMLFFSIQNHNYVHYFSSSNIHIWNWEKFLSKLNLHKNVNWPRTAQRLPEDCPGTALGWQKVTSTREPTADCLITVTTAWQLPDDCPTTDRWLPNDCPMTARWLPDDCPRTARGLPDDCLTTAQWLPDDCTTTARRLPDDYLTILDDCLTILDDCLKTLPEVSSKLILLKKKDKNEN